MNFGIVIAAGLVSLPVGFIWYHPKVFGNAWMKTLNITNEEEFRKGANMAKTFGLTILFSIMYASFLMQVVVHQNAIYSILQGIEVPKDAKIQLLMNGTEIDWAHRFRTFGHGAFHGFLTGLFFVLPTLGVPALFERKSFKYIFINVGYWIVCSMLMGGIICAWL